jgi:hypothetical protein
MKIKDIVNIEDSNEEGIILIKEGMFWLAYERSAFRFVRLIQKYSAVVKLYKNTKSIHS